LYPTGRKCRRTGFGEEQLPYTSRSGIREK
jgi:hypothetical protein